MLGRSWMTALTLALGTLTPAVTLTFPAARAQEATAKASDPPKDSTQAPDKDATPPQTIRVDLSIAGLGPEGCDVEIKPAHAGTSFTAVTEHIKRRDNVVYLKDVATKSADRYCSFAITVREPGQAERTERRGMRLTATPTKGKPQTLQCYLNSPSRIAKVESETTTTTKR